MSDFDTALANFIAVINEAKKAEVDPESPLAWTERADESDVPEGKTAYYRPVEITKGKKNVKIIVHDGAQRFPYCFVEIATGRILKAASWSAPAKGGRGSIYDVAKYVEQGIDFTNQRWLYR